MTLLNGFNRFRQKYFTGTSDLYENLKTAQRPHVLVIACSDSRVDPAILFDSAPGELFVVRNVANLVPPCLDDGGTHGVSAALEFAVCSLEVKHVVVLGHSRCGGIRALLDGASGKFISQWMNIAREAIKGLPPDHSVESTASRIRSCEQASIVRSLDNLRTFLCIRERVQDGRLAIHGWFFDIEAGALLGYNPGTREFETLSS